jgi:hypothetical protein
MSILKSCSLKKYSIKKTYSTKKQTLPTKNTLPKNTLPPKKKGFIKYCLEGGYSVTPVYTFGEVSRFSIGFRLGLV